MINVFIRKILDGDYTDAARILEAILSNYDLKRLFRRVIVENDIAPLIYNLFNDLIEKYSFSNKIISLLRNNKEREKYRDELLVKTIDLLDSNGFDYVVFKTFNNIGTIDVDIDLMIHPWDYWDVVNILLENGFYAIDDLSKTYATGLMIHNNPIVLDLHTMLTVLGIPYVSHEHLFRGRKWVKINSKEYGRISVKATGPISEALVRIAHAVIKEAEIKLDDVFTVAPIYLDKNLESKLCKDLASESLEYAGAVFTYVIMDSLAISGECMRKELAKHLVGLGLAGKASIIPPYNFSRTASIIALLHRLIVRSEIYMLSVIPRNVLYRRNAAHIGHLFVKSILR